MSESQDGEVEDIGHTNTKEDNPIAEHTDTKDDDPRAKDTDSKDDDPRAEHTDTKEDDPRAKNTDTKEDDPRAEPTDTKEDNLRAENTEKSTNEDDPRAENTDTKKDDPRANTKEDDPRAENQETVEESHTKEAVVVEEEAKTERNSEEDSLLPENKDGIDNIEIKPSDCQEQGTTENDDAPSSKGCCQVVRTARFQVYVSQFLSSWGDRMWMFAGGLFLLEVTPGSLRLAAVYGAALALTVIILGAPIGRLVDRTSRLKMAQLSLCVQNLMVCVCAGILVIITTKRHLFTAWDGWSLTVAEGFVILTACIAQIGTLGSKLTIEKDWILVICGQDQTLLAGMNSVLRSLDLSTEVLAPVIVGAIMTTMGMAAGGIFIAIWNISSLVIEYGLLHYLYHSNKDLQKPKLFGSIDKEKDQSGISKWKSFKGRFSSAWGAWLAYMRHPVRDAGLGLALLFMTVLAFDNYSRAFVFESGVSETILGVLTAVASLFGIFGALLYPRLRARFNVTTTGLIGFGVETFCLIFCVASVFAPGSPFDASALISSNKNSPIADANPISLQTVTPSMTNASLVGNHNSTEQLSFNEEKSSGTNGGENDYTSVALLLFGIITSRTGLWLADLSVTQILQEGVEERQRGAINGVQSSLNQSLDLFRSILLIILPTRATFGFLILLSFLFVATGWCLFGVYTRKQPKSPPDCKLSETEQLEQLNV